jgi:hypothetical protein
VRSSPGSRCTDACDFRPRGSWILAEALATLVCICICSFFSSLTARILEVFFKNIDHCSFYIHIITPFPLFIGLSSRLSSSCVSLNAQDHHVQRCVPKAVAARLRDVASIMRPIDASKCAMAVVHVFLLPDRQPAWHPPAEPLPWANSHLPSRFLSNSLAVFYYYFPTPTLKLTPVANTYTNEDAGS